MSKQITNEIGKSRMIEVEVKRGKITDYHSFKTMEELNKWLKKNTGNEIKVL